MNQRETTGLPLRAIVMVLLFLGVVFLLVGFQAIGSGGGDDSASGGVTTVSTSTPTPSSAAAAAPKADVRVYNISEVAGAAENAANKLRAAQWNVTETGNLTLEGVTTTTVYYGTEPGEQRSAEEVGKVLGAPALARPPALEQDPPGVIVAVTG